MYAKCVRYTVIYRRVVYVMKQTSPDFDIADVAGQTLSKLTCR